MNLQDAMQHVTKKMTDELGSIYHINQGYCDEWVEEVLKVLDKEIKAVGWWLDGDKRLADDEAMEVSHCVLWCEGKFYDCLYTDGADDPLKLAIVPDELLKDRVTDWDAYEDYKNLLNKVMSRGNPPDLWDYSDRELIEWGVIL